ncbi:hypothetical protein [Pararhizobium haloflavum]|uniref:hypothetical protein n=1 Tax=Pararhizobium haloflavum TaxID=2037914 RepID=UPI000C18111D|nr:hypothetical protein [Pararhizobium haloflavum]
MTLTGNQMHAARVLVGLEVADVAKSAGLAADQVQRIEARGTASLRDSDPAVAAIRDVLLRQGIVFLSEGGRGVLQKTPARVEEGIRPCDLDATNDD